MRRALRLTLGWLLVLVGLPLFLLPVPLSFAVMALGLFLLAQESFWVQARLEAAAARWPHLFGPVARLQNRLAGRR